MQRNPNERSVKPRTLDRRAEKTASAKKSIAESVSRSSGKFKNIAKIDKLGSRARIRAC